MMVDADDLIPGHIDNVGIALLRIYQDNLVVLREFTVNILNIYQSDVQNLSQLVSTVTVDFPLIACLLYTSDHIILLVLRSKIRTLVRRGFSLLVLRFCASSVSCYYYIIMFVFTLQPIDRRLQQ